MITKVVLDTNVLVSALLTHGSPAAVIDMVAEGKLIPFFNDSIIREYWDVLQRPKFSFHPNQISRLINNIVRGGFSKEINEPSTIPMTDEDDRIFYDTAIASGALLVTGNIKHYPRKSFIVTPADFLKGMGA